MDRADRSDVMPLSETIGPLLLSALAGTAVISVGSGVQNGPTGLVLTPLIAFFCVVAVVVLVLPVFATWQATRRPSYPVAVIWGVLVAWVAAGVTAPSLSEVIRWQVLFGFGSAGALSGLVYSYVARRKCSRRMKAPGDVSTPE